MGRSTAYENFHTPDWFFRALFALWLFFTLVFGLFSDWAFKILADNPDDIFLDGLFYTAFYTTSLIGSFALSWKPLNNRFPLHELKNLTFHSLAQISNFVGGFILGTVATKILHNLLYNDANGVFTGDSGVILSIVVLMNLIGFLTLLGLFYTTAYMKQSMEAEKRRTESELSALRSQINPHFLFNSLNSIAALVQISPEEAEAVTQDLADVFRYTLRASDRSLVSLRDELEIVRLYLNIEQARFKERLNVQIDAPDSLLGYSVPVLVLQPLVENAIKHGVSRNEGIHTVNIGFKEDTSPDKLIISVTDTGSGFPFTDFDRLLADSKGTGLKNVFRRLQLHFGDDVSAHIINSTITLRIPRLRSETGEQLQSSQQSTHERIPG